MIVLESIKEQEPDPREGEHAPGLYSLSCTSKLGQRVHPWVDLLCLPQQGRSVAGLRLSDSVPRLYLRCAIPTCRNLSKLLQLRSTCIVKEQARPGEQTPEGGARESGVALCGSWWAGKAPLGLSRWLALSCVQSSSRSGELSLLRLALWVAALCYSSPDFQRQVHLGR